ncbi:MAG: glycine cleavage system protein H [Bacteroidetes bacterium]|nr:MAG: glycine cleavage system protein H [Bacteroidota bacterium]
MESFNRVDIFDTKGIEYLFVIGYLLFLIIFWNVANKHERIIKQIKTVMSTLSAGILRIPQGLFYNRFHTWTHLEETGAARVGLDDFLQHITGEVKLSQLKNPGDLINKGDLLTQIDQNGKQLKLFSPISGRILDINSTLKENPGILNEDPYEKGWIYKIKPSQWMNETNSYLLAEEATIWSTKELDRFKDFLSGGPMRKYSSEPSMILLQDGGEIRNNILSELPNEVWIDFQEEFLNFSR